MGTINLATASKSRLNGIFWTLLWMFIIFTALDTLTTYVVDTYDRFGVVSLEGLDDKIGWSDDGPVIEVRFANAGRIVCILILLLQVWHLLETIFAWRSTLVIDLDEGRATSATRTWRTFPLGRHQNITPINRIKKVKVVQSTTNRLLGVGAITIEADTFVLQGSVPVSLSISGVSDPFAIAEQIRAAMPPHQGLLLAHTDAEIDE